MTKLGGMKTSRRVATALALLLLLASTRVYGESEQSAEPYAELRSTFPNDLRALSYATPYYIWIKFPKPLSNNEIEAAKRYEVLEKASRTFVDVRRVTTTGREYEDDHYARARVWGTFHPQGSYQVRVSTSVGLFDAEVVVDKKLIDEAAKEKISPFARAADFIDLWVAPSVMAGTTAIGFQYELAVRPPRALEDSLYQNNPNLATRSGPYLYASGELSTRAGNGESQRSMVYSARYDLVNTYLREGEGEFSHYDFGFALDIADFEVDQTFDLADYVFKVGWTGTLPGTDKLGRWWLGRVNADRRASAIGIRTQYAVVEEVKDSGTRHKDFRHRWDSELQYTFPLAPELDLETRWQAFLDFDDGTFANHLNIAARYFIGRSRRAGLEIQYRRGRLPPSFVHTQTVSFGVRVVLF